ncbi:MAG: metallophosphoesterase [Cyanobacteria bacterium Co-bin13]|nr:metallophosphoesterase [Cyanobacteria bacterium Co-bin13]
MASILDPAIPVKITKMKSRVCWQHPAIRDRKIDQTRLALDTGHSDEREFSFLVIGDSGSGPHTDYNPQRKVAEAMLPHLPDCRFLLHTGDVVYQVGSSEQYPQNFIQPYREWLVGGSRPETIAYDQMVFQFPFLAVPGNHDYYNLPWAYGLFTQVMRPLRRLLGTHLNPNIGWHGSYEGDAYARAFLDYLKAIPPEQLSAHLDAHYTGQTETGRCLQYRAGEFTRLPNRYYSFHYGGIDFFALDSSTFNTPSPLPQGPSGSDYRRLLHSQRDAVEVEKQAVVEEATQLKEQEPHAQERLDDLQAKIEQLDEVLLDIEKQLTASPMMSIDAEQLLWLKDCLVSSWRNPEVRGRVLFFHHPPYVTEVTKWHQGQTLAVRQHLRWVLDEATKELARSSEDRPLVDLVLCGHAHCFEYLRTLDTGHADSHINWLVCGGSGLSLRRQRPDGPELSETFLGSDRETSEERLVAKSQLYVGLSGHKSERRRPYSFLRIDVKAGSPPRFEVKLHVSERHHQTWEDYALDPLML